MKKFLGAMAAVLAALMLAAPAAALAQPASQPQRTLSVYNWGDYIEMDENGVSQVLKEFEEETGIKVIYSTFGENEEMYAKVAKGGSQYDIVVPSDYMVERMAKQGLLAEIDKSKLANYQYIDPEFRDMPFDPGGKYSVPYMWGTVGIVYNKAMVTDPVDSWSILWDKKYAKKIIMYDSSRDTMSVALIREGYTLNSTDEAELKKAEQALVEQKPLVLSYSRDDIRDKMLMGEAALAVVYSGDAVLIMQEAENAGMEFGYSIPKEGSNIWMDNLCILASSQHKEEAMEFIDFLCRPDIMARNSEYIGYAPPAKAAYEMLSEELRAIPAFYPADEEVARCTAYRDLGEFNKVLEDAWTRVKAAPTNGGGLSPAAPYIAGGVAVVILAALLVATARKRRKAK
jgi:spermidine/putrescine transport system substrate-binding protein